MNDDFVVDFIGKLPAGWWVGVVEEANTDPMTLGRVKVRIFGFHPEDRGQVPTKDLPWAIVLQPTTSAATSGIGWSPTGLEASSWVMGFFLDGNETAQYPVVVGTIPRIHRPNAPQNPGGATGAYTSNTTSPYFTGGGNGPYHGEGMEDSKKFPEKYLPNLPGKGAETGDNSAYLTNANKDNWPLTYYKPSDFADHGSGEIRIHLATALALDAVAKETGKRRIISGYRSPARNNAVGGATKSMHMYGRAFDTDKAGESFIASCIKHGFTGFGCYEGSYHVDTGAARYWGPDRSARSAPKDFVEMLYRNGWSPRKRPLDGSKATGEVQTQRPDDVNATSATSSNPRIDPTSRQSVREGIVASYREAGYNDVQIAGVLAAADSESTYNPTASGDAGSSHGLFQWRGDRFDNLQSFASQRGTSWQDPQTQIDFSLYELNTTHQNAGRSLQEATSPAEASLAMSNFERHVGWDNPSAPMTSSRINLANRYSEGYNGPGGINTPQGAYNQIPGFNDPTNSLPYGKYQGGPSTHPSARGENSSLWTDEIGDDDANKMAGFPAAGDIGTFTAEPQSARAPKYGYNMMYNSKSGHQLHFDDSPGAEVVSIQHRSGSKEEFNPGGSTVSRTVGNRYVGVKGDEYHGVIGDRYVTAQGDQQLRSTSDTVIHADGALMLLVYNDRSDSISGRYDLIAGDRIEIKSNNGIIVEAPSIDFYSTGSMSFEAEKQINFKSESFVLKTTKDANVHIGQSLKLQADKKINFQSGETFQVKSGQAINYLASGNFSVKTDGTYDLKSSGVMRVESAAIMNLKAPTIKQSPTTTPPDSANPATPTSLDLKDDPKAKSTDLGTAPARRSVKKKNIPAVNPDVSIASNSFKNYADT